LMLMMSFAQAQLVGTTINANNLVVNQQAIYTFRT